MLVIAAVAAAMHAKVGVLALQGAFVEHVHVLRKVDPELVLVEVRNVAQLEDPALDALIIPGGESTTMGLIAERNGMLEPLRKWVRQGKPVWVRRKGRQTGRGCRSGQDVRSASTDFESGVGHRPVLHNQFYRC